jgi:hypothetical protein
VTLSSRILAGEWLPTSLPQADYPEVRSGPETGVASSPDKKKSINCGRAAADVNKGEPPEKMTSVEFLRIKMGDLDSHHIGLEHSTCHRYPDGFVRSNSVRTDQVGGFSNTRIGGLFCLPAPQNHVPFLLFQPERPVMDGWLILNKPRIKTQPTAGNGSI